MKMVLYTLCHFWINSMYKASKIKIRPLSNVFALNYGVQKGLGPVKPSTSMFETDLQLVTL